MTATTRTISGTTYELYIETGTLEAAKAEAKRQRDAGWLARATVDNLAGYVWRAPRPATDEQVAGAIRAVVGTEVGNASLLISHVLLHLATEAPHLSTTREQVEAVALQVGRVRQPNGYEVVANA
jgi:hypothetical protein